MAKIYPRTAISTELTKYDHLSKENDFLEVTKWHNGEGFDVTIDSEVPANFQMTYGTFRALKKMVKKLEKHNENN